MSPARRRLRLAGIVLVATWAVYVATANVALGFGIIPRAVAGATSRVRVSWTRAYSWWPGRVTVKGFTMQLEDEHNIQMDLAVDESTAEISFLSLFRRRIRFEDVRAAGVSYRMSAKVDAATAEASPDRVAAFPRVPGFDFPPVRPAQRPLDLTPEQLDGLWQVELQDVEAQLRELWFDEYRYEGPGFVSGAFALVPMKSLWVGPATLRLDGGALSAGPYLLSSRFIIRADTTIAPVDLLGAEPIAVLGALTAYVRTEVRVQTLGFARLYVDDVELDGTAFVSVDLAIRQGRVSRDSTVKVRLENLRGTSQGFAFSGSALLAAAPTAAGGLGMTMKTSGELVTPLIGATPLRVLLEGATAELSLGTAELAALPAFESLSARVDAEAPDARPITSITSRYVPVIAPAVLGNGPITATATATVRPGYALVRVRESKLGDASLEGSALWAGGRWRGAAAGRFGRLPLGLFLDEKGFGYRPFIGDDWLPKELQEAGIMAAPALAAQ